MQELARKGPARGGHGGGPGDVAIDEEGDVIGVFGESFEDVFAAGEHLVMVIGGDVGREQLGLAGFVLRALHRVGDEGDGFLQRREYLVALRFIVLDEVATEPEFIAGIGEGLRAQTKLGLDDRAGDHAAVLHRTAKDAPHVFDVHRRAVEQAQIGGRHPEIIHLGVFDIAHALVVADGEGEERGEHGPAVDDVTVEKIDRVGDLHLFAGFVDLVDEGIDATGKIVGGRHLDVGAG